MEADWGENERHDIPDNPYAVKKIPFLVVKYVPEAVNLCLFKKKTPWNQTFVLVKIPLILLQPEEMVLNALQPDLVCGLVPSCE